MWPIGSKNFKHRLNNAEDQLIVSANPNHGTMSRIMPRPA